VFSRDDDSVDKTASIIQEDWKKIQRNKIIKGKKEFEIS
jgi:hypothetical protein